MNQNQSNQKTDEEFKITQIQVNNKNDRKKLIIVIII